MSHDFTQSIHRGDAHGAAQFDNVFLFVTQKIHTTAHNLIKLAGKNSEHNLAHLHRGDVHGVALQRHVGVDAAQRLRSAAQHSTAWEGAGRWWARGARPSAVLLEAVAGRCAGLILFIKNQK